MTAPTGRVLTMGSLFDGIGGFPLAAVRSGIEVTVKSPGV